MFQSAIPVLRISNSSAAEESRRPSWASSSSSLSGPNKPTHVTRALSETASQSLTDSRADDPSRWINPCRQGRIYQPDLTAPKDDRRHGPAHWKSLRISTTGAASVGCICDSASTRGQPQRRHAWGRRHGRRIRRLRCERAAVRAKTSQRYLKF